MELKRVVVTGLGAITPIGNSVPEFWENLVNGVSGAGPITHFDASLFKTQFACEVKGFDATKYIDRKEARKMDLYTQYAIAVAKEAVGDSGLHPPQHAGDTYQHRADTECHGHQLCCIQPFPIPRRTGRIFLLFILHRHLGGRNGCSHCHHD